MELLTAQQIVAYRLHYISQVRILSTHIIIRAIKSFTLQVSKYGNRNRNNN